MRVHCDFEVLTDYHDEVKDEDDCEVFTDDHVEDIEIVNQSIVTVIISVVIV